MLARSWEGIVEARMSGGSDVLREMITDRSLFRAIFGFLFDNPVGKTFVCFGTFGAMLAGAANQGPFDSVVWVPDWQDPESTVARLNPTSREIVAVLDRLSDDVYPPQCWADVSREIDFTPTTISDIRCVIDSRVGVVGAATIESSQLVKVESMLVAPVEEKAAKSDE